MTYTLENLLNRAYDKLGSVVQNSEKIAIDQPSVTRMNRKTFISNFEKLCNQINRDVSHVYLFMTEELRCTTSIDSKGALVCGGNFKDKGICKLFTQYIKKYVQCNECKSFKTNLNKKGKLTFKECLICKSSKSI